jgi:transcriptional regulator with XRE-family HTH domain
LQSGVVAKSIYSADQESLLKVLARIRSDAGLSQQQLARRMAVSQSTVSDILRGQRRLDVIEWISFCKACRVTPEQFLAELTFLLTRQ